MRKYVSLVLLTLATPAFATDLRHVEDASLRSVFFIDPQEGWIVGDEGVILHTIDGGKRWERQPTGTARSLRSVQFLTPFIGWAVGREELPYGQGSVGVILFTSDGGLEWKKQLPNSLPGMNQVCFVDQKTGFLYGDGNDQFPFGVFKTTDSGKSWEPVAGPRTTSWLAADFFDGSKGILVGAWSRLAVMRKDEVASVTTLSPIRGAGGSPARNATGEPPVATKSVVKEHADWLAGRDITSVQILGKKTIAVGQGGLILTSATEGKAWGFVDTKLPTNVLANLDFHAVHSVRDNVWIAGRPGSVILHSGDGGATWSFQKTGQPLPLHGVFFFDEKLGFAVGDAGTIVKTMDGGKNWIVSHQGGKRAQNLIVHSLNKNAPLDLLPHLGLANNGLTTSIRVTAPDTAVVQWDRLQDSRRYAAAIRAAGGMTGETLWHFPMPQHLEGCDKKTILAHWNQLHRTGAEDELMRQLVLALRIWQPSKVIADDPASKVGLTSLVGTAVEEACRRAADPNAYPEQLDILGLSKRIVRSMHAIRDDSKGEMTSYENDQPLAKIASAACDFVAPASALLMERPVPCPKVRHLVACIVPPGPINALPEETSTREKMPGEANDDKTQQSLRQQRTAIAMADNITDPAQALKLIPPVLEKLPDEQAAFAAFAIASRYAERGQWYAAQEFYLYLVDRAPAHPLAAEAYRWLLTLNTSSEAKRRHELKHFVIAEPIALTNKKGPPLVEEKVVQAGHIVPAGSEVLSRTDVREWNKGGAEWGKRLSSFGNLYSFDPHVHFCWQAGRRNLGDVGSSNNAMNRFRKFVPSGAWHDAARAEMWLTDRSEGMPARLGRVRYTEVRPYLDGKFDDPCWQGVKPMLLDNAVGDTTKEYKTEAMFAFDQEFLYIALKCTHPDGQRVAPLKPRPRDADVDGFDRVSILLDLDRDYQTYYHLEVDRTGALRDSCWGDRNWNPKWFVAVHTSDTAWHIEAAIPLSELTGERITQQTAWAFNVVRVMPGRGVQSWSSPADVRPRPEGMSVLLFDHGKTRVMPGP